MEQDRWTKHSLLNQKLRGDQSKPLQIHRELIVFWMSLMILTMVLKEWGLDRRQITQCSVE